MSFRCNGAECVEKDATRRCLDADQRALIRLPYPHLPNTGLLLNVIVAAVLKNLMAAVRLPIPFSFSVVAGGHRVAWGLHP